MSAQATAVDARWMGRAFANDRELALPERPRLIPELVQVPLGDDALLFYGGDKAEVLKGRSARTLLPRLLQSLDGHRSIEQIAGELSLSERTVHDVVSLLFSRGLLEEGAPAYVEPALDDTARFLGRVVDVTRTNRNREEAVRCLANAVVGIYGHPDLGATVASQLRSSGIRSFASEAAECDLGVVVTTGDMDDADWQLRRAVHSADRTMILRLGRDSVQIGPMLTTYATCCASCFVARHPHPKGVPAADIAALWVAMGAQQVFNTLAKIAPTRVHTEFRVIELDDRGEMFEQSYYAVRTPGCHDCGIPQSPLPLTDGRLSAWIYHCATSFPPRETLSPRDHQGHYAVANVQLAAEPKPALSGSATAITLPEPGPLTAPLHLSMSLPQHQTIGLRALSTLLANCAGEIVEGPSRRHVAPTGGNLGSVDLWAVVRQVDGLACGVYRYDGAHHRLEWSRAFSEPELERGLSVRNAPDCIIVGTGDLARCAQKYKNFAYRLIHFDSGVTLAYLHAVSSSLGISLAEYADFDAAELAGALGIPTRWEFPVPTFAVGLGAAVEPSCAAASTTSSIAPALTSDDYASSELLLRMLQDSSLPPLSSVVDAVPSSHRRTHVRGPAMSLDEILHRRRAVRDYSRAAVERSVLQTLVDAASEIIARRRECGAARTFVRPALGVARGPGDLEAGFYEVREESMAKRAEFGPVALRDSFNQSAFADAPAAMFTVADLGQALKERGVRGYRELCQDAGALVGYVWLIATGVGLVGTAAGGVIPAGLRRAAALDGFNECPLLSFVFGHASADTTFHSEVG